MTLRTWSADIQQLGDRIAALTVVQALELGAYLAEAHGVHPAGPVTAVPTPDADRTREEPQVEPAAFDVVLVCVDAARRVAVIRAVREAAGLGLKEARDLVDAVPRAVREGLPREQAEQLKARLEEVGAEVSLRPCGA